MAEVTLGVIVGNRDFFPDQLVNEAQRDLARVFGELGIESVMLDEGLETWTHAQRCAELFRAHRDRISGVLVCLPNFGDEKGVADALKLSELLASALDWIGDFFRDFLGAGARIGSHDQGFLDGELRIFQPTQALVCDDPAQEDEGY